MINLSAFYKVSKTAYLVAFITFCIRAGHFMSLPFLAIYLTGDGLFSSGQIGLILGISGFTLSVTGLFNGMYIDRTSYKKIMVFSLLFSGIGYFCFTLSMKSFFFLLLINATLGWLRSLIEVSLMTILKENTKPEDLSYAFSARFIGANLGVVLGPLIGGLMAQNHSLLIFIIAGFLNIFLGFVMLFFKEVNHTRGINQHKLLTHFNLVIKDKLLLQLTLINFILWLVYVLLDTTLPQHLAHTVKNPAAIFSVLMIINALICVFFQPIILRWAELTSLKLFGIIGCVMFSSSFLLLSAFSDFSIMILSVVLMSFGELFTMPINSLLVMKVAPRELIASYNGLYSLGMLGISLGPLLGGMGLEFIGSRFTFLIAGVLPFIAALIYILNTDDF